VTKKFVKSAGKVVSDVKRKTYKLGLFLRGIWRRRRESNPHGTEVPIDFESSASF